MTAVGNGEADPPDDDPPTGTNALAGGATTCTGIPNSEKVSVETVVIGPAGKAGEGGGKLHALWQAITEGGGAAHLDQTSGVVDPHVARTLVHHCGRPVRSHRR